ncbi:MAG: hypothetical protein QM669_12835, partial [Siphonobacter sp.]
KIMPADILTYAYPAGMVLVVLFAFWVSFEIMIGIVWLATNQSGRNHLPHFAFLSVFYLLNLVLAQLHNMRLINWNLLYLSPFVVFAISTLLGFWGMKKREDQEAVSWLYVPQGALLYLGLSILCISMLAYVNSSANDSAIEALEDGINYVHITGGILFFFYVFFNFGTLMRDGKPVYRILFKPPYFGRFHIRGLAAILTFVLLYFNGYFPFYQAISGYYNAQGDLATARQDYRMAETLYQQGVSFEFQNHKSNYGLASLAWIQGDFLSAAKFFRQSLAKQPSPYAYAGLSRSLQNEDLVFESFFAIREGLQHFPENGELMSNMAYLQAKANGSDSALYYYEKAIKQASEPGVPAANLMGLYLKKGDFQKAETYTSTYLPVQVNQTAMNLLTGKKTEVNVAIPADSVLTLAQFALLSNAEWQGIKNSNLPVSVATISRLESMEGNASYYGDLQYLRAMADYYRGNKLHGLDLLSARAIADTAATGDRWRKPLSAFLVRETAEANDSKPLSNWQGEKTLLRYPLNRQVLARYVAEANKKKQYQDGYQALLDALRYEENAPDLLQMYILQATEMGLMSYAEDKLRVLQKVNPVASEHFLPVYQQKRALIEKQQSTFQ